MEFDHAHFLPEFDAVCAWTLRDTVIIEQVVTYLARKRQNVFFEVEELETYTLSSADAEGIIGVFAWSACDCEGRRRLVVVKTKEATRVASMKQYAMMRAMQNEEYQELHEVIEYMNERQEKLMSTMERKQKLIGDVPVVSKLQSGG